MEGEVPRGSSRKINALFIVPRFPARTYPGKTMGPDYLAGILQREGHGANVVDLDVHGLHALHGIDFGRYNLVGISYLSFQTDEAMKVAELVNRKLKKEGRRNPISPLYTPIVVGGAGAVGAHEYAHHYPMVDAFCEGEGFGAISDIASSVGTGNFLNDRGQIRGLSFYDKALGKTVRTQPRPVDRNIDPFFPPARLQHSPTYNFTQLFGKGCKTAQVMTQIGCPSACVYCGESMLGPLVRERSIDSIRSELEDLVQHGYRGVYFDDSTFTHGRDRFHKIVNLMKDLHEKHGVVWGFNTRIDCLDRESLEKAKQAGCVYMFAGVESLHPDVLRGLNKVTPKRYAVDYPPAVNSPEEYIARTKQAYNDLKQVGIQRSAAFLIFGGPKRSDDGKMGIESLVDAKKTIDETVDELQPTAVSINILRFIPNVIMSRSAGYAQLRGQDKPFSPGFFSSRYRQEQNIFSQSTTHPIYQAFEAASDHYPIPSHMTPEHCYDILSYLVDKVNAHNANSKSKMDIVVDSTFKKYMPRKRGVYELASFDKISKDSKPVSDPTKN